MIQTIYPVITLHQPWATWIMRGWKLIETRTHPRFAELKDKNFLIHAGKGIDQSAINNPYLSREQILHNPDEIINGFILGRVHCYRFAHCDWTDSKEALIDCQSTLRYGLFLQSIHKFPEPIKENGELGIWYYDIEERKKVKKPKTLNPQLF